MPGHTILTDGFESLSQKFKDFDPPITKIAVTLGGITALGVGALAVGAVAKRRTAKRKTKRKTSTRKKTSKRKGRKLKFGSPAYRKKYLKPGRKRKQVHRSRSGKVTRHKHRGTKAIHYTKNRQPYIILASGKARFIKKSSAKRSRKQKGGRY